MTLLVTPPRRPISACSSHWAWRPIMLPRYIRLVGLGFCACPGRPSIFPGSARLAPLRVPGHARHTAIHTRVRVTIFIRTFTLFIRTSETHVLPSYYRRRARRTRPTTTTGTPTTSPSAATSNNYVPSPLLTLPDPVQSLNRVAIKYSIHYINRTSHKKLLRKWWRAVSSSPPAHSLTPRHTLPAQLCAPELRLGLCLPLLWP